MFGPIETIMVPPRERLSPFVRRVIQVSLGKNLTSKPGRTGGGGGDEGVRMELRKRK